MAFYASGKHIRDLTRVSRVTKNDRGELGFGVLLGGNSEKVEFGFAKIIVVRFDGVCKKPKDFILR